MEKNVIKKKLETIKDLPTLPAIAMEVNRMLNEPDTTVGLIAETIENDQAIAVKVLKLINSAFYGVRSRVTNIHDAVVLLGFNSIRNIVLSVSVVKAFLNAGTAAGFNISEFWEHSIAVAISSKYLSEKTNGCDPEECFAGGLLHDIGKIIIAHYFPDIFIKIIDDMEREYLAFGKAEEKYLPGMGHAKIGGFLAEKWKLPPGLTEMIKRHHSLHHRFADLGRIVHTADLIVNIQSVNKSSLTEGQKQQKMPGFNPEAVKKMQTHIAGSGTWYPELADAINEACLFFNNGGS